MANTVGETVEMEIYLKKNHRKSLVEKQFHGIKVRMKTAKCSENVE